MTKPLHHAALLFGLLATCSAALAEDASPEATKTVVCGIEGRPTRQEAAKALVLRRTIEASPFFTLPATTEGLATCHLHHRANGVLMLEYRFRREGTLTIRRDERIEYMEQEGRFELPSNEAAEMVLVGAEHAAFGTKGCGVDWHQPHKRLAEDDPAAVDTIYRGDTCNCQARIRRGSDGNVMSLLFRSAC